MTINDQELNEQCLKIKQWADDLAKCQREGYGSKLFCNLMLIQEAAEKAQERMNKITPWNNPILEPMGS